MPLTLNNDLKNLKIGDYFWCKYTAPISGRIGAFTDIATKTDEEVAGLEIPASSASTVEGYFKYICVDEYNDKKIVLADRNVQHSVSWDELNKQGISSGSGVHLIFTNSINTMSENISIQGEALSSDIYDAIYEPYKAFDDNETTFWSSKESIGWLGFKFNRPFTTKEYFIQARNSYPNSAPLSWTFEGSMDGVNYKILDTISNQTGWKNSETRRFTISNEEGFYYYRINVSANNGYNLLQIASFNMTEYLFDNISFTTRLLTGGETSGDTAHSEWDQYIVNSSLNGSITPGDAQAWSINSSLGSWTSTVPSGSPSSRVSRGRNTVAAHTFAASSTVSGVYGFRPLLEIEVIPPPPVTKYLVESDGEIKKYISSIEGDMIKEDAYTGEGTLLYIPVYKEAFIRVK